MSELEQCRADMRKLAQRWRDHTCKDAEAEMMDCGDPECETARENANDLDFLAITGALR